MTDQSPNLVSTQWLADHLEDDNLIILDASWYKPEYGRVGWIEYKNTHIPRSGFFDMEEVVDLDSALANMLPPPEEFAEAVGDLGITNSHKVVLYDTHENGFYSAARVWWLFKVMGHDNVAVLDGGFVKWLAEKRAVETDLPEDPEAVTYKANYQADLVIDLEQMKQASQEGTPQIIDARTVDRFKGDHDEGVPGLRHGHIPHSKNLYYGDVFAADATLKPVADLKVLFEGAGIDLQKPIISTCNSGITACILALALDQMGFANIPVYDASWAQWGREASVEIRTGV